MSKIKLDNFSKAQAKEYANNEAEIHGFKIGSEKWKQAFKGYLIFATSTMTVGRNPRKYFYKVFTSMYPEVFSEKGFAGEVSKNYSNQDGTKGLPVFDVNNRILSAIMNLMRLYENGILGIKTTTHGRATGKIPSTQMSDMQIPNREDFQSEQDFEAALKDIIYNWFARDIVSNCILETLMPFFLMSRDDVDDILGKVDLKNANLHEVIKEGREELVKHLRRAIGNKFKNISYVKSVIG